MRSADTDRLITFAFAVLMILTGFAGAVAADAVDRAGAAHRAAARAQAQVDEMRHQMTLHHPRGGPKPVYVRQHTSASIP